MRGAATCGGVSVGWAGNDGDVRAEAILGESRGKRRGKRVGNEETYVDSLEKIFTP